MKGDSIPSTHYVARHCRASELSYGADGEPAGVTEIAFRPKPDDVGGISVVWLDFFSGTDAYKLNCIRSVISLHVTSRQKIAIIRVGVINATIAKAGGPPAVIEDPCDDLPPGANAAHALLGPIGALNDKTVREAIASSVRASDVVSYKITM